MATRAQRRPITDEDRKKWALASYHPYEEGGAHRTLLKNLATEFGRNEAVITREIQKAFQKGLVKVVVASGDDDGIARNRDLEDRLVEKYEFLKTAIVVNVHPQRAGVDSDKYSDDVHEKLGAAFADAIARNPVALDDKAIAVSSGRAIHAIAAAFPKKPKLKAAGVSLLSLTGSMYFDENHPASDADRNVDEMRASFPASATFHFIGKSLFQPAKDLRREMRKSWLSKWRTHLPDYAILGVGIFTHRHRLWEYVKHPEPEGESLHLAPIANTLKDLADLCELYSNPAVGYFPVADIANHLYFVDPPDCIKVPASQRRALIRFINEINSHFITVKPNQLKQIKNIMLVAGTHQKVSAIRKIVEDYKNLACLTVDSIAAKGLLELP